MSDLKIKAKTQKHWTEEELQYLQTYRGQAAKVIAIDLGRSLRATYEMLRRKGLQKRTRLTPEEKKEIVRLRKEGLTWAAIVARTGRSIFSIQKCLQS